MTYYVDLSLYEFLDDVSTVKALNIGWLNGQIDYPKGETTSEFQARLWHFCRVGVVNPTRGWHDCELCVPEPFNPRVGNRLKPFGSAEIRVFHGTKVYAAPDLIHHYATVHEYNPPEEFIEAILNCPLPGSIEYEILIKRLGVDYWIDQDNNS